MHTFYYYTAIFETPATN